jgi:hypothetical protein
MTFKAFIAILFPYRTHLEEEVDYLRAQLSQKQRRIDEMQEALIAVAKPAPPKPRPEIPPVAPVKRGWEAYRKQIQIQDEDTEKLREP